MIDNYTLSGIDKVRESVVIRKGIAWIKKEEHKL